MSEAENNRPPAPEKPPRKALSPAAERGMMLKDGVGVNGFALSIGDAQAPVIAAVGSRVATYGKEALTLRQIDRNRQQDAWAARWTGAEPAWIELRNARPVDLSREANGAMVLAIDLRVTAPPSGPVLLGLGAAACTPTVTVDVKPITIYAKLDADVRLRLDQEVKDLIQKNPNLF